MLTGITLENFKAFKAPQYIPIKPITLVFGPNSAGKSSVVHALAFLKHVHQTNGDCNPGQMKFGWSSLELGSWQNLVFGHDKNASMMIKLHTETVAIQWRFENIPYGPRVTTFQIEENGIATARGKNVGIEGIKWRVELHSSHSLWGQFKAALWTKITGLPFERTQTLKEQAEALTSRRDDHYVSEMSPVPDGGNSQDIFEDHFNQWLGNSWRVPPINCEADVQPAQVSGPAVVPSIDSGVDRSVFGQPFEGLFPRRAFSEWSDLEPLGWKKVRGESATRYSFDSEFDDIPF